MIYYFLTQRRSNKVNLVTSHFMSLVILLAMIAHLYLSMIILLFNNSNKMVHTKLFSLILLTKKDFTCINIVLVDSSDTSNIILHINLDHEYY